MFQHPFSFQGRIRRREYGITFLVYFITSIVLQFVLIEDDVMTDTQAITFMVIMLPLFFIVLAQAVKRSHDLGNSGWYVLIPFYALVLLFADSIPGPNQYGDNPKGIGNDPLFTFERNDADNEA